MRKDQKDWIEEVRNKILPKGGIAASRRSLNGLLAALFPRNFSAQQAGDGEYRQWEADKRVACEDYMWRYLNSAVPDHDVADADLNMLLAAAGEGDQTKTMELLRPMLEPRRARIGAKKLRRLQDRVSDPQRKVLATMRNCGSACWPTSRCWKCPRSDGGENFAEPIARFVHFIAR